MKSQVSFKCEGEHTKQQIINILTGKLKGFKYIIENENEFVYRIYIASEETEEKTFNICYNIQSNVVFDYTKEI